MENKMCLGTVQFGLNYGIANKNGKPSLEKSLEMLNYAYDNGIRWFDTAQAYGNAEEILGKFVASRNDLNDIHVISKLLPHSFDKQGEYVFSDVEDSINSSLNLLNLKVLDGFLFHTPEYIYREDIIEQMILCREKGFVKNIGVSIYEVEHAIDAAKMDWVDYIQIPHSVFDQRVANSEFFELANQNNKTVFARSAFLQGLSLMDLSEVPERIEHAKEDLKTFERILAKYSFSKVAISELFSLKDERINFLVFGVDSLKQLEEDIRLSCEANLPEELIKELKESFKDVDKSIVMPSLWTTKKPDFKRE
jgi:aryl-alcohol dehydrogenase-like predicted oxidoreductase